jgi:DNA adenine methylase
VTQLALDDWRPRPVLRSVPLTPAEPFLRWVGGKGRLLPDLLARAPRTFGRYYEPFCGGAALFFALQPARAVLGDANADLIACYRAVAGDAVGVTSLLEHFAVDHNEERYYEVRDDWNAHAWDGDPVARAAAFIYLNRTCFNGLWRVNRDGEMNVPIGKTSPGALLPCEVRDLTAEAAALARAALRSGDYRATLRDVEPGDFVYLDCPYDVHPDAAGFTAYTASPFGVAAQRDLAFVASELIGRGVQVMLSNADTPLVRELHEGLRIDVVQRPGTVSSKGSGRGKVAEVLVCGGYDR